MASQAREQHREEGGAGGDDHADPAQELHVPDTGVLSHLQQAVGGLERARRDDQAGEYAQP